MYVIFTWDFYRIAALTTERLSWEDWKKLQKENAAKVASVAAEEESQMKEYRAQLDADRNAKLAKGTNNAHLRIKVTHLTLPYTLSAMTVRPRLPWIWLCKFFPFERGIPIFKMHEGISAKMWHMLQESSLVLWHTIPPPRQSTLPSCMCKTCL